MNKRFLARRILQVLAAVFGVLTLVYLARGQTLVPALEGAALWAAVSTLFFACTMIYQQKTQKPCAVCVPEPERKT